VLTKIGQFYFSGIADEQIGWLHVSVQNEVVVAVRDCPQNHHHEGLHISGREEDFSLIQYL
jgi:hypothetical protein